jgi:hypothetical protein
MAVMWCRGKGIRGKGRGPVSGWQVQGAWGTHNEDKHPDEGVLGLQGAACACYSDPLWGSAGGWWAGAIPQGLGVVGVAVVVNVRAGIDSGWKWGWGPALRATATTTVG